MLRPFTSVAIAPPAGRPCGHPHGGAAPERRVDPEPYIEHPEDNNDGHAEDDLGEEEASSLHPSRDRAASSLGRPAPSPATAPRAVPPHVNPPELPQCGGPGGQR